MELPAGYLTEQQAADRAGRTVATLKEWRLKKRLPHYSGRVYRADDIDRYKHEQQPGRPRNAEN